MAEHFTVIQYFVTLTGQIHPKMYLLYCSTQLLYNHLVTAGDYFLLTKLSLEDHVDFTDIPCKNSTFLSRRVHHPKISYHSYLQNNCKFFLPWTTYYSKTRSPWTVLMKQMYLEGNEALVTITWIKFVQSITINCSQVCL